MSDSNSQQQQTSNYTDNRAVLGQSAVQATGGSTITQTNYTLDAQVVNRALDTVDKTTAGALDSANASLSQVASFGGKVLDQVANDETMIASAYADAKGQGALTQKILIAAVVGALLVAFVAVKKG